MISLLVFPQDKESSEIKSEKWTLVLGGWMTIRIFENTSLYSNYFCLAFCALNELFWYEPPYKGAQLTRQFVTKSEGCCVHTMTSAKKAVKRSMLQWYLLLSILASPPAANKQRTKSIVSPQLSLPITCSQVFTLSSLFCAATRRQDLWRWNSPRGQPTCWCFSRLHRPRTLISAAEASQRFAVHPFLTCWPSDECYNLFQDQRENFFNLRCHCTDSNGGKGMFKFFTLVLLGIVPILTAFGWLIVWFR
jgi:hypothetical protein